MRYLISLIALAFCLNTNAATFPNRFTTNADGVLINGSTLTNLPWPIVYVSPIGLANGLATKPNNGAQYGVDTAGTTTCGIQEALNSLPKTNSIAVLWGPTSGGGTIRLLSGAEFVCSGQVLIDANGPFDLHIEGDGFARTLLKYTGATNFIQDYGSANIQTFFPLQFEMRNVGLAYVRDTNQAALVQLNCNRPYFENCVFTIYQSLRTNSGVASSHLHIGYTPTNLVGTIGVQLSAGNMATFQGCDFCYVPFGIVPMDTGGGIDQLRVRDCLFFCPTNKSIYAQSHTFVGINSLSACGILATGSNTDIEDCHFQSTQYPWITAGATRVIAPRYENGLFSSLTAQGGLSILEDPFDQATPLDGSIAVDGTITLNPSDGSMYTYYHNANGFNIWTGGVKIFSVNASGSVVGINATNLTVPILDSTTTNSFYFTGFGTVNSADGGGSVDLAAAGINSGPWVWNGTSYKQAGLPSFGVYFDGANGWTLTNAAHPAAGGGIIENQTGIPISSATGSGTWLDNDGFVPGLLSLGTNIYTTNVFKVTQGAIGTFPVITENVQISTDASNITTGTVGTTRLGSGPASSSTFLRGDQTWASVSGGVANVTNFTAYSTPGNTGYGTSPSTVSSVGAGVTCTINQAGTYLIQGNVGLLYLGSTYAGAQYVTNYFRRINNTAASLPNSFRWTELPVLTTFTGGDVIALPPVIYTATSGDQIQIFGNYTAAPSVGSVNCNSAEIVAIRLY